MIYATSDLHGFPLDRFKKLLDKAGFSDSDTLYVLGDVIDRNGDGGVEALRWFSHMPNVRFILGNHESMMLACPFIFEEITDELLDEIGEDSIDRLNLWVYNGASPTIESLIKLEHEDTEELHNVVSFVKSAPLYETASLQSGEFVLTHAGLGGFRPDKPLSAYLPKEMVWHRPTVDERFYDDRLTIFGHTPTFFYGVKGARMLRTDTWIDIDTGAAGGEYAPMLLRLDDLKPFYEQ